MRHSFKRFDMTKNHAAAIIRWREEVDRLGGGLDKFEQSATVSTMLFGCHSWLDRHSDTAAAEEISGIQKIKAELESWMQARGRTFTQ